MGRCCWSYSSRSGERPHDLLGPCHSSSPSLAGEGQGICFGHRPFHHLRRRLEWVFWAWDRPFGRLWSSWHDEGKFTHSSLSYWVVRLYWSSLDFNRPLSLIVSLLWSFLLTQGLVRIRALQVHCASKEALIKRLKKRIGSEGNALKKFKESSLTLG